MSLVTLSLPHLPSDLQIHIALYTCLRNASFLRSQLLAGNPDFEYALIDATTILSSTHLLTAIFRATNDWMNSRLKSRNIHSEIVFCLGSNNNIATTLNTFGISAKTTDLLVVKVACPSLGLNPLLSANSAAEHLRGNVEGEIVDFEEEKFKNLCNIERVKGIYKLGIAVGKSGKGRRRKDGSLEGERGDRSHVNITGLELIGETDEAENQEREERERKELEVQILGLMALRGAI